MSEGAVEAADLSAVMLESPPNCASFLTCNLVLRGPSPWPAPSPARCWELL